MRWYKYKRKTVHTYFKLLTLLNLYDNLMTGTSFLSFEEMRCYHETGYPIMSMIKVNQRSSLIDKWRKYYDSNLFILSYIQKPCLDIV